MWCLELSSFAGMCRNKRCFAVRCSARLANLLLRVEVKHAVQWNGRNANETQMGLVYLCKWSRTDVKGKCVYFVLCSMPFLFILCVYWSLAKQCKCSWFVCVAVLWFVGCLLWLLVIFRGCDDVCWTWKCVNLPGATTVLLITSGSQLICHLWNWVTCYTYVTC